MGTPICVHRNGDDGNIVDDFLSPILLKSFLLYGALVGEGRNRRFRGGSTPFSNVGEDFGDN